MTNKSETSLWNRLDWVNVGFLFLTPIAALIFTPLYFMHHPLTWGLVAFFVTCYSISNMAITCGYHRYFSHRSYDVHPVVEFFYVFFGAGAFQSSILQWCADHRRHHRVVDSDEDPYSINKGFWFAHLGWMLFKDPHPETFLFPKDLQKSKHIQFQHSYYGAYSVFVGFILPGLIGWACGFGFWGGLCIGGILRTVLTMHSTFLINSAAHFFGTRPYTEDSTARDNPVMAFLTFGEGYHNFHHFFQADYRNGVLWYQWDPTKWWIRSLAFLGLAKRLKQTRKEEILKARLRMEEMKLVSKGACATTTQQLRGRLIEAAARIRQLKDDYLIAKQNFANRGLEKRETIKREIRQAKAEFRTAYEQWRDLRRATLRAA